MKELLHTRILNLSMDGFCVIDLQGKIVEVNDACSQKTGYSREELLEMHISDLGVDKDAKGIPFPFKKVVDEGSYRFETSLTRKDGTVIDFEISGNFMDWDGGRIFTFCRDITERKKYLQALKDSEKKYRAIYENIQDVYFEISMDGEILDVSPSAESMSGYTREELIGKSTMSIHAHPEERQKMIDQMLEKTRLTDIEIPWKDKSGNLKWGSLNSCLETDDNGNPVKFCGTMRDITERKRYEAELEKTLRRYRELYESSRDAYAMIDMDGKFIECNTSLEKILGYSKEELYTKTIEDVTPERWHRAERDILEKQVMVRGYSDVYYKEYITSSGEIIPIEIRAYLRVDDDNNPVGMWAFIRDISHRKRSEEALKESELKLQSIMTAAPIGIGVVKNRIFQWVNDYLLTMIGYEREELIGQSARILYESDEEYDRVGTDKYRDIRKSGIGDVETKWVSKNGEVFDIFLRSTTLEPGNPDALVTFTALNITERRQAEEALAASNRELVTERVALERKNIALEEVLHQVEEERRRIGESIRSNMEKISLPLLQKMLGTADNQLKSQLQLLMSSLTEITSPFVDTLESSHPQLTPREIEICNMIRNGLSSKEIAMTLNTSIQTVFAQRKIIRRKLGISKAKANLSSYLKNFEFKAK